MYQVLLPMAICLINRTMPGCCLACGVASIATSCSPSTQIPPLIHASTTSVPYGDTQIGCGSLLLDFGAGIIRNEAFADYDGVEFAGDVSRRAHVGQLCPPGTTAGARASQKRVRTTAGESSDERPSQRPRRQPRHPPLHEPPSQTLGALPASGSPMSTYQPSVIPHVSATHNVNSFETGTSSHTSTRPARTFHSLFATSRRTGPPDEYINFGPCNCICS